MRMVIILIAVFSSFSCLSQGREHSTRNAHSHNDYEQARPFYHAWENKFGSIEADIFLHEGKLIVAHDSSQLARRWTLDSLYLSPLKKVIESNGGSVYGEKDRALQLMIDIKSEGLSTLAKLVELFESYSTLKNTSSLIIVISGNRPDAAAFSGYPAWILFDGELQKRYTSAELSKVPMMSDNFARYSDWKGSGTMPAKDKEAVRRMIEKAHRLKKKVRFWNAPDDPGSWKILLELGVDYINTDRIDELTKFVGS